MTGALRKFWGERVPSIEVKPGVCFFRRLRHNITEMAKVVDVRNDIGGIPHVHFSLSFEQEAMEPVDGGDRILSLPSFVATYHERA